MKSVRPIKLVPLTVLCETSVRYEIVWTGGWKTVSGTFLPMLFYSRPTNSFPTSFYPKNFSSWRKTLNYRFHSATEIEVGIPLYKKRAQKVVRCIKRSRDGVGTNHNGRLIDRRHSKNYFMLPGNFTIFSVVLRSILSIRSIMLPLRLYQILLDVN